MSDDLSPSSPAHTPESPSKSKSPVQSPKTTSRKAAKGKSALSIDPKRLLPGATHRLQSQEDKGVSFEEPIKTIPLESSTKPVVPKPATKPAPKPAKMETESVDPLGFLTGAKQPDLLRKEQKMSDDLSPSSPAHTPESPSKSKSPVQSPKTTSRKAAKGKDKNSPS
jgi:hypothetical protein